MNMHPSRGCPGIADVQAAEDVPAFTLLPFVVPFVLHIAINNCGFEKNVWLTTASATLHACVVSLPLFMQMMLLAVLAVLASVVSTDLVQRFQHSDYRHV